MKRRIMMAVLAAAVLMGHPVVGQSARYKVTAPACFDGGSQTLSDPTAIGSYETVRNWIRRQQKGGPPNVRDGICEHWTNEWTIYRWNGESWDWFRSSYGCR